MPIISDFKMHLLFINIDNVDFFPKDTTIYILFCDLLFLI